MLALTLHQPWASLCAYGVKRFETRSWLPKEHRGDLVLPCPLAIHAGKSTRDGKPFYAELPEVLERAGAENNDFGGIATNLRLAAFLKRYPTFDDLPLGAVVGVVHLRSTHRTEAVIDVAAPRPDLVVEEALGDYTPGRFAWELGGPYYLETPIEARGYQRLWYWPEPADLDRHLTRALPCPEAGA